VAADGSRGQAQAARRGLGVVHWVAYGIPTSVEGFAADFEPEALPRGLTRDELLTKLEGHTKAAAGIVGLFRHP